MYLDHFGLRETPFSITPHTEFFFAGANRGSTLEALIYAITHDEGIVKVSGEVGSGKTMLCRMLLEKLPRNVETVYLANPSLSRGEILHAIAEELQIPLPESRTHQLLRSLQDRLIDIYAAGRQVVVMIDEAHAMPPETLEEIRLLSNLESNRHKLVHIVLFGQPELDERLSEMSMRQLKERITHNFALEPLRRGDIGNYLMFRMRAAGYRGPDIFTQGAIQLISKSSEGLTRRINILADKSLLSAFSEDRHQIDGKQVKAAIRDAQFNSIQTRHTGYFKWVAGVVSAAVIATVGFIIGTYNSAHETILTPTPTLETSSPPGPPTLPQATSVRSEATLTPLSAESTTPILEKSQTLADRLASSETWLKETPGSHYFIQLYSADASDQQALESFFQISAKSLDPQQIRAYRSSLSGKDRIGIIYGDFVTRETAYEELAKIVKITSNSNAYVRTVKRLR